MSKPAEKPKLYMAGPKTGAPSFEDIINLFRKVTGREPTAQELEEARREWEK